MSSPILPFLALWHPSTSTPFPQYVLLWWPLSPTQQISSLVLLPLSIQTYCPWKEIFQKCSSLLKKFFLGSLCPVSDLWVPFGNSIPFFNSSLSPMAITMFSLSCFHLPALLWLKYITWSSFTYSCLHPDSKFAWTLCRGIPTHPSLSIAHDCLLVYLSH